MAGPRTRERQAELTARLVTTWDWEADCRWRCPSADEAVQRWWARRMLPRQRPRPSTP